ncbi:MAG: PilN domain-containing protein [Planctomycetaceae bacterium]|nr:PilN domain-containing protein [Planctomycetaceae bacterium]
MIDVDFLPEYVAQRRVRRNRLICQANLLAIAVAGFVVLGFQFEHLIQKASAEQALQRDRVANVRQQLVLRTALERQEGELQIKQRINQLLGSRVNASEIMAELDRILPQSVTLTSLSLEPAEINMPMTAARGDAPQPVQGKPPEKTVKRLRVTLTGVASTDVALANFIGQLSACQTFEDVSMGYARTVLLVKLLDGLEKDKAPRMEKRAARAFQVSCYIVR